MAKGKVNIPMCLAGILLCLTLFSMHFSGGLYARYTTSGTVADSARVAVLQGGTTVTMINAQGYPGLSSVACKFEVTNYTEKGSNRQVSEVALQGTLTAENLTNNIPLELKFYQDESCTVEAASFSFNAGEAGKKDFYLQTSWPQEANNSEYAFEIDALQITVIAEQVD